MLTMQSQNYKVDFAILEALKSLGYSNGEVKIEKIDRGRYNVFFNKKHIGIYDTMRHTFTD